MNFRHHNWSNDFQKSKIFLCDNNSLSLSREKWPNQSEFKLKCPWILKDQIATLSFVWNSQRFRDKKLYNSNKLNVFWLQKLNCNKYSINQTKKTEFKKCRLFWVNIYFATNADKTNNWKKNAIPYAMSADRELLKKWACKRNIWLKYIQMSVHKRR